MTDPLNTIAKELRQFAAQAHGNPPVVKITAKTVVEYAEVLERRAIVGFAGGGGSSTAEPCPVVTEKPASDVQIDTEGQIVTIFSIRYAMDLFRHMGIGPLNHPFELTDRRDGVVTIRMMNLDDLVAWRAWQERKDVAAALTEWRDARQAIFDHPSDASDASDASKARWSRLADAEHALMACARTIEKPEEAAS